MPVFEVRLIPVGDSPAFAGHAQDLPQLIDNWLSRQHGGSCVGRVTAEIALLEITAPSLDSFRQLIDAFVESAQRGGRRVQAVIVQKEGPILTPAQTDLARSLTPHRAKLTKQFLGSLPAGAFVASQLLSGPGGTPLFAEPVADSTEARNEQWARAVAAGVAQRTCLIFSRESDFREWFNQRDRLLPDSPGRDPAAEDGPSV